MKTKERIAATLAKVEEAEQAVKDAKKEHRAAFRVALAELFNEYELSLDAEGCEGCDLVIVDPGPYHRKFDVSELPE